MKWAIVYDDLTVKNGDGEAEFKLAPSDGVQFVVWENGEVFWDRDFYWYLDGIYDQTNDLGPLLRRLGWVKYGRTTSNENFEAARTLAVEAQRVFKESP